MSADIESALRRQKPYSSKRSEDKAENTLNKFSRLSRTYWLAFPDSEDLGAALRAYTLCCGLAVLHFDRLRVLDLHLGPALHTVCLHVTLLSSFLRTRLAHNCLRVNRFGDDFIKIL